MTPAADLRRRSSAFLLVFALANAGGVISYHPFLTLLLPIKVGEVAGGARMTVLTGALIAGSVAASLANILFGWLSDRLRVLGVGRRGAAAAGLVAVGCAYAIAARVEQPRSVVYAVVLVQVAVNALLAPMLAIMAEEVSDRQKGLAGGLLALGLPLASACAVLLVASPLSGAGRLMIVPLLSALCVAPLLLWRSVPVADAPADGVAQRPPPRDLAIAWGARLLVQVAGNVLSLYLLYYLGSVAPELPPGALATWAGNLLTAAAAVPLPVALLVGRWSDRSGRRKPFLLAAAGVAAAGVLAMALAGDRTTAAAGFMIYAAGSAVFLALHSAFAMQLLPRPDRYGRDLGLLNLANTLPGLFGPAIAWSLATPGDFAPALVLLSALTFAGGLATLAVRTRR